ncbi:MAG: PAS domain-containing protein [Desulfotomaculaceae bacterium]
MTVFDFEKFFNSTPIPSCVIQDEYFKLVNKGFIETTGYTELELLESSAASLVHPGDIDGVLENTVNCLAGKDMPGSFEFRVFSREGETVNVSGHFTRIEVNGQPAVLVQFLAAQIKDMTVRRKALNELFNSERKYRQLVEMAWEGIWSIDDEAVTTYVNPRMAEILGYTADEMIGRSLFSFMDEQGIEICSAYIERRRRGIREQHDFEFLYRLPLKTGRRPGLILTGRCQGSISRKLKNTAMKSWVVKYGRTHTAPSSLKQERLPG